MRDFCNGRFECFYIGHVPLIYFAVFQKTFGIDNCCKGYYFVVTAFFFATPEASYFAVSLPALEIGVGKVIKYNPVLKVKQFISLGRQVSFYLIFNRV